MSSWLAARNILAVGMDTMGDVVMIGPALRALKEGAPGARLTLLASPAGAQVAELLPWVDEALPCRAIWQDRGRLPFDPERELELVRSLAERRFDAALVFTSCGQTPHAPAYACYLAGIPLRAGASQEFGGSLLTTALDHCPDELHQVERNLRLVEAVGFAVHGRALCVAIPWEARSGAADLLSAAGIAPALPYVIVHPGAGAQARRYDPQAMGAVARMLGELGHQVLVTGTARELPTISAVLAAAPAARALPEGTSLPEYAALIERAALVICGNTLPLHLADALDTPVLALCSGADYESQWRPRSNHHTLLRRPTACHPCYLSERPIGQPCLAFAPGEVVEAAQALLAAAAGVVYEGAHAAAA